MSPDTLNTAHTPSAPHTSGHTPVSETISPTPSPCEQEPIHIPGNIQPHGALLIIHAETATILAASANLKEWLGLDPHTLLGQPSTALPTSLQKLLTLLTPATHTPDKPTPKQTTQLKLNHTDLILTHYLHHNNHYLEFERTAPEHTANLNAELSETLVSLGNCPTQSDLHHEACKAIRHYTAFDRVMLYQFDPSWHGTVIAESHRDNLEPLLGLYYPNTDIPAQVRALFYCNPARAIPNTRAPQIPLLQQPQTPTPDLTYSDLRGLSPTHSTYLSNMGIGASLVLSIQIHHKLWGLIICHHTQPRPIHPSQRQTAHLLTQILSQHIQAREDAKKLTNFATRRRTLEATLTDIGSSGDIFATVNSTLESLLPLINSSGLACIINGVVLSTGITPSREQILKLNQYLLSQPHIWSTDCLSQHWHPARHEPYRSLSSGILHFHSTRSEAPLSLIWFRPEHVHSKDWAGEPIKTTNPDQTISPRTNFARWRELIHYHSIDWDDNDREIALSLGRTLVKNLGFQSLRQAHNEKAALLTRFTETLDQHDGATLTIRRHQDDFVTTLARGHLVPELFTTRTIEGQLLSSHLKPEIYQTLATIYREAWNGSLSDWTGRFPGTDIEVFIRFRQIYKAELLEELVCTITDLRTATQAIDRAQQSDIRFHSLFQQSIDAILIADNQGRYVEANPAACELFGYTQKEFLQMSIYELMHNIPSDTLSQHWAAFLEKGRTRAHVSIPHRDGHLIQTESLAVANFVPNLHLSILRPAAQPDMQIVGTATPAPPDPRRPASTYGTTSTTTPVQNAIFPPHMEALEHLASGIAHDFNNYLATIALGISLLDMEKNLRPDLRRICQRSSKAVEAARLLNQQLLTFARSSKPERAPLKLHKLVREVVDFALHGSAVEPIFSPPFEPDTVLADRGQIYQVITNIIINARQAMSEQGKLHIILSLYDLPTDNPHQLPPGHYIQTLFQDTGPGIPAEVLNHIFEPYYTTKKTGSGLGLPTSQSIIRQHGGVLNASSQVGAGAIFSFILPLIQANPDDPLHNNENIAYTHGLIPVLDDYAEYLESLGQGLRAHGATPLLFSQASALLEQVQTGALKDATALVLDLTLPGQQPMEDFAPLLRKELPHVPIIFMSGNAAPPASLKEMPHTSFIQKPFEINDLIKLIQ